MICRRKKDPIASGHERLLALYVPSAGSVTTQIAIPNAVALAGQFLHQQVVPIEFDAVGNIVALTSTNALTLTIGAF